MDVEVFAEWLKRQGHQVFKTESSYWFDQGPRTYQAFPYHWIISPSDQELQDIIQKYHAIGLRYSTPVSSAVGCISYHTVYDNKSYGFENLGRRTRKNTNRGLNSCIVEPISFDCLAGDGFFLQIDTMRRQGRRINITKSDWEKLCMSASDLPGFEAWGARVNGSLASSLLAFQMRDIVYILSQQSDQKFLNINVNNALTYVVTKNYIEKVGAKTIHYGLHSLNASSNLDQFKVHMGYRLKPIRQRVVFNRWLIPFCNSATHSMIRLAMKIRSGDPLLSKSEGMMRFYRQGKLPLSKQEWPEILEEKFQNNTVEAD